VENSAFSTDRSQSLKGDSQERDRMSKNALPRSSSWKPTKSRPDSALLILDAAPTSRTSTFHSRIGSPVDTTASNYSQKTIAGHKSSQYEELTRLCKARNLVRFRTRFCPLVAKLIRSGTTYSHRVVNTGPVSRWQSKDESSRPGFDRIRFRLASISELVQSFKGS